jgi:hypothetical protein
MSAWCEFARDTRSDIDAYIIENPVAYALEAVSRCTPNNHDPWDGFLLPFDGWTFNECFGR